MSLRKIFGLRIICSEKLIFKRFYSKFQLKLKKKEAEDQTF